MGIFIFPSASQKLCLGSDPSRHEGPINKSTFYLLEDCITLRRSFIVVAFSATPEKTHTHTHRFFFPMGILGLRSRDVLIWLIFSESDNKQQIELWCSSWSFESHQSTNQGVPTPKNDEPPISQKHPTQNETRDPTPFGSGHSARNRCTIDVPGRLSKDRLWMGQLSGRVPKRFQGFPGLLGPDAT